jgi:3-hydroxybutyrate dehydrogenase
VLPTPAILGRLEQMAADRNAPLGEVTEDYLRARQPSGKFIAMEDVAALVAFLCGPSSQGITGAVLPVDGGWTIK